jgi:enoyl-CoA hydratase
MTQEFAGGAILLEKRDSIAKITLNNPPLNPVNAAMEEGLVRAFESLKDDTDVNVIILTGSGKSFSAGGNLDWILETIEKQDFAGWTQSLEWVRRTLVAMLTLDTPIIAKVNGPAIGFGATIALFSDIICASDTAVFADPHVVIGLVAGDGGSIVWPKAIGYPRAKRFLLTGDRVCARDALAMGLVSEVVPAAELDDAVEKLARKIVSLPPRAVRGTKRALNIPLLRDVVLSLDATMGLETYTRLTEDHEAAVRRLREKAK